MYRLFHSWGLFCFPGNVKLYPWHVGISRNTKQVVLISETPPQIHLGSPYLEHLDQWKKDVSHKYKEPAKHEIGIHCLSAKHCVLSFEPILKKSELIYIQLWDIETFDFGTFNFRSHLNILAKSRLFLGTCGWFGEPWLADMESTLNIIIIHMEVS